eukprot:scaffold83639_cov51-Attheya_sp.AAC.1
MPGQKPADPLKNVSAKPKSTSMLRRSSSLAGEESDTNHFSDNKRNTQQAAWRRQKSLALQQSKVSESHEEELSIGEPLFSIGVLADIQYAPIPDGFSYGGIPRYYRHALVAARDAAQHFQRDAVSLVINLGDIIDGKCQEVEEHGGIPHPPTSQIDPGTHAVDEVLEALSEYQHGPILHTYGNHELYNLSREDIGKKLNIPFRAEEPHGELVGYYSHLVEQDDGSKLRFVVLDTYDIAMMGRCKDSSMKRKLAERLLAKYNPNFPDNENSPEGLMGNEKRFVAFNGGVDEPQLEWLRTTLQEAKQNRERVIVLSHQPILPGSSSPVCLIWNYHDVLKVLRDYSCTVIASFSGHAHRGGYQRDDESGIHFRVIEATLESPDPHRTYGFVDMHRDRIVVRGLGNCTSA